MNYPIRIVADSCPLGFSVEILSDLSKLLKPDELIFISRLIDDFMKNPNNNFEIYEPLPKYDPYGEPED